MQDLITISKFIADNSLAILIVVIGGGWVMKIITPFLKAKIQKYLEKDGKLEDEIVQKYFDKVEMQLEESQKSNEKIMKELVKINSTNEKLSSTNEKLSSTNEELSKTTRELIEVYGIRLNQIEQDVKTIIKNTNGEMDEK